MTLLLNPSSGNVGEEQTIECVILDYMQNDENQALWVSWDNGAKQIPLDKLLCLKRPNGQPNTQVNVQVFSCGKAITKIAVYTFFNKSNIQVNSLLCLHMNRKWGCDKNYHQF